MKKKLQIWEFNSCAWLTSESIFRKNGGQEKTED